MASDRAQALSAFSSAFLALLLLCGCTTVDHRGQAAPGADAARAASTPGPAPRAQPADPLAWPPPASTPAVAAGTVPPDVESALTRVFEESGGPPAPDPSGSVSTGKRVRVRDMELDPNGHATILARGEGALCHQGNCAIGVFELAGAQWRPLLLAMSSAEPQLYPLGTQGRPALMVSHVDSPHLLRWVRHSWDGAEYRPDGCMLYDRSTNAAGRCERANFNEVDVYRGSTESLCRALANGARSVMASPIEAPLLDDAFLIRRSERTHVQALRLPLEGPDVRAPRLARVVSCLRRAGFKLREQPIDQDFPVRSTARWSTYMAQDGKPATVELRWTELPDQQCVLLTLGIVLGPSGQGVSSPASPVRSTTAKPNNKPSLETQ